MEAGAGPCRTVADYTALDATTIPRASITATTPNTQNSTTSLVEVRVSASAEEDAYRNPGTVVDCETEEQLVCPTISTDGWAW